MNNKLIASVIITTVVVGAGGYSAGLQQGRGDKAKVESAAMMKQKDEDTAIQKKAEAEAMKKEQEADAMKKTEGDAMQKTDTTGDAMPKTDAAKPEPGDAMQR